MRRFGNQHAVTAGPGPRRLAARGLAVAGVAGLAVSFLPAASWAASSTGATVRPVAAIPAGALFAWGVNETGQDGSGINSGNTAVSPVAVKLPAGTRVTTAQEGCGSGYALTTQGQMLAWGENDQGQLGDGAAGPISIVPVPVSLPPGTRVTSFRAGCDHVLALTSTGEVLAWGNNTDGDLGDGGAEAVRTTPVQVHLRAGLRITAVSAGDNFSLALTATGQVLAWGANDDGRLGDGGTELFSATPVPVKLPAFTRVTAISAGVLHSLAVTASGGMLAWGVTRVSAGFANSMALTSFRQVLAWGSNENGELGTGTETAFGALPVLVKLPAGSLVTAISAGHLNDVALTATGRVYSWGAGNLLGTGSSSDQASGPVQAKLPAGVPAFGIGTGSGALTTLAIVPTAGR
jgi:alpha-tubulin suppressor-like RCC1 family protein